MKLNYLKLLIPIFALFLMSCIDEPAPPQTEKEIIAEISREWNCQEDEEGFPLSFNATIASDPANETMILISNFHKLGYSDKVSAIIKKDLSIILPEQTILNQTITGTGDISNDFTRISWDYTIENADGTVHITGTYSSGTPS